ncbi:MAG: cyclic nucleotide-binding domain-containing protein [Verrucomicrobiota bacterium]|nr:cyclic nucleotide-binding domain-containing protein [Verrucomicrobiota bacterium]
MERAFFLKKVSLFSDLDLEFLLAIAEKLHEEEYDAGEKIFHFGQVANRIYFIARGSVRILTPSWHSIQELASGDYFGDESLFNDEPRSYQAQSTGDSLLYTLSRSHLLAIISECPSVAVLLLQTYARLFPCRYLSK